MKTIKLSRGKLQLSKNNLNNCKKTLDILNDIIYNAVVRLIKTLTKSEEIE